MEDVLQKSYLFQGFERPRLQNVLHCLNGRIHEYQKGEIVLMAGEICRDILIVLHGELCVSQFYENGKEQIIQKAKEAYLIGAEIALSVKKDCPYTVYCTQDATLFCFPADAMYSEDLQPCDRFELFQKCLEFLANESIRRFHKIEIMSIRGVRPKVLRYLSLQQKRFQTNTFAIEYNREELANYLDVNRSVLSHELKAMERDGLIRVYKNNFTLL